MKKIMKKALSLVLVLAMMLVPMTTVMAAEGDSEMAPINLTSTSGTLTVDAGKTVYYCYQNRIAASYVLTVEGTTGFSAYVTDPMTGTLTPVQDTNGKVENNLNAGMMGRFMFAVENTTETAQTYTYALVEPLGTYGNPEVLEAGVMTTAVAGGLGGYVYKWTAPAAGTFVYDFQVIPEAGYGWMYAFEMNGSDEEVHWYTDGDAAEYASRAIAVEEGDVIKLKVNTYSEADMSNMNPAGQVSFSTFFEATEKEESNAYAEEGYDSLAATEEGEYLYLDGTVNTTLYIFEPTEVGIYTITVDEDMTVSNWGTEYFPNNQTENPTNVLQFTCTSVGQGFLVGIAGAESWQPYTTVAIERGDLPPVPQVNITVYENKATINSFTFTGDADALEYIETFDTVVESAVLGTDGYYHLNEADGEILYIDLDEAMLNLIDAAGYGQLSAYPAELEKVDYNAALLAYAEVADPTTKLYPLTEDLITIMKEVGNYKGWYGANGFIGGEEDDAWMFLCYYGAGATLAPVPAPTPDTQPAPTPTPDAQATPNPAPTPTVPDTGDNTNFALWIAVLGLGVVAIAGSIVMKKRTF